MTSQLAEGPTTTPDAAVIGPRRPQKNGRANSIQRLAWFLLVLFFFVVIQIFHFHWRVRGNNLSLELSFELPEILEASKARRPNSKQLSSSNRANSNRNGATRSSLSNNIEETVEFDASSKDDDTDSTDAESPEESPKKLFGGVKVFSRPPRIISDHKKAFGSRVGVSSKNNPWKVPKTLARRRKKPTRKPKYLDDLTEEEKFTGFVSSTIPFVEKLKSKHPYMTFLVIPTDRWSKMDNHTCIPSRGVFQEADHRVPYALILGAQKAGSSALAKYLYSHSRIVPTRKELHFLSERMDFYNNDFEGIDQEKARNHYLAHISSSTKSVGIEDVRNVPNKLVLDATPMYLSKSDRVPHRVLCLCPWARLIVLLREPISRVYSQYNMDAAHTTKALGMEKNVTKKKQRIARLGTFDEVIERDYDTLIELGVLLPESATDRDREQHYGSKMESEAWKVYTKLGTTMPIGRSLYSIQLRHWIEAYKEQNQPLRLLAVKSDDMKDQTESTYRRVLDFLELPHELPKTFEEHHKHGYDRINPMSDSTRAFLERIFEPYNRQLKDLIGPEWDGIWQYSHERISR